MPFNDKGEWTNDDDSPYLKECKEKGYQVCGCREGVHLHQAGFEVDLHMCANCGCEVADPAEFFKYQDGVEVLSK